MQDIEVVEGKLGDQERIDFDNFYNSVSFILEKHPDDEKQEESHNDKDSYHSDFNQEEINSKNNSEEDEQKYDSFEEDEKQPESTSILILTFKIAKKEDKQPESEFTQNLIFTISHYETLTASLGKADPMRTAYKDVISSLKKQLLDATKTLGSKNSHDQKQVPVDNSFNQLSVSEIVSKYYPLIKIAHGHGFKGDTFNDRDMDKSLEAALNSDLVEHSTPRKEERKVIDVQSDYSDEGYETELEEIYTAYT